MSQTLKRAALLAAGLAIGLVVDAGTCEAAAVSHHRSAGRVVNPGPGRGGAFVHGGTTAVRATSYRPAAGPRVVHASHTAGVVRR